MSSATVRFGHHILRLVQYIVYIIVVVNAPGGRRLYEVFKVKVHTVNQLRLPVLVGYW